MFNSAADIGDLAHAIQMALAPVFLLTGIAGLLNVMVGRLARTVDRGRLLSERPLPQDNDLDSIQLELQYLERRRHYASAAISACTFAALLVCTVITAMFLEVLVHIQLKWLVGLLFTSATLALVVGLAYFLREVNLATRTVRIPVSVNRR
jgi:thiosulfate reductase cytochrome b subunit